MLETIVGWLDGHVPPDGLVVDLGAGTGALSAAILDALPDVRVLLVDVDPDMLATAASRLRRTPGGSSSARHRSPSRCRDATRGGDPVAAPRRGPRRKRELDAGSARRWSPVACWSSATC